MIGSNTKRRGVCEGFCWLFGHINILSTSVRKCFAGFLADDVNADDIDCGKA